MNKLAIVADTTMNFTFEMAEAHGVTLVPYYLQLDDQHLRDQVDITSDQFYRVMERKKILSTGIPSVQEVTDVLDTLKKQGYTHVLCLVSSEKLTGMKNLYEVIKSDYQGLDILVYDTEHIAMSAGLLTMYAGYLNQEGVERNAIVDELDRVKPQTHIFALFRTLKYLVKGGRFNKYKGMLGTFLNVQPLLTAVDGAIEVADKLRGKKKSLLGLVDRVKSTIGSAKTYHLVLFSGHNPQELAQVRAYLSDEIAGAQACFQVELTPVLGVHAGPGALGAAVLVLD